MPGYLVELQVAGRTAVVIGLGGVGGRRAAALVAAGAHVLAIDPAGRPDLPEIELRAEPYRADHLDLPLGRPALVVAAATAQVNRRVVADARARGLPVNSATEPATGDFAVPATWRSGGLVVGVSTGGSSPALARLIRDRIALAVGPNPGTLATILVELRSLVLEQCDDPVERRRLLRDWGDPRWLERLEDEGIDAVERALREACRRAGGRGRSGD